MPVFSLLRPRPTRVSQRSGRVRDSLRSSTRIAGPRVRRRRWFRGRSSQGGRTSCIRRRLSSGSIPCCRSADGTGRGWKTCQGSFDLFPSGAVRDDDGVAFFFDFGADVARVPVHFGRDGLAAEMPHRASVVRACGGEEVAVPASSIPSDPGPETLPGPDPRQHSLRADARFILERDFDRPRSCGTSRANRELSEFPTKLDLRGGTGLGMQWSWRNVWETRTAQRLPDPFQ